MAQKAEMGCKKGSLWLFVCAKMAEWRGKHDQMPKNYKKMHFGCTKNSDFVRSF